MRFKIQYFEEIIYNISSKIYIRLYEGIKFCTFSGNLFDDYIFCCIFAALLFNHQIVIVWQIELKILS